MKSWRDAILEQFVPDVAKFTLVSDPDSIMTEEKLKANLQGSGFELIEFADPVEFRYFFETKIRPCLNQGDRTNIIIIQKSNEFDLNLLPFDLLQVGRCLHLSLGALFPCMSYPVIKQLDHMHLDKLFDAQFNSVPDRMGDNITKDYVLAHVFNIIPKLIKSDVDLLRILLKLHYGNIELPVSISDRLIGLLETSGYYTGWALDQIISDSESFFTFLQERWPIFLQCADKTNPPAQNLPTFEFKISGPPNLPFSHHEIRVYIDNLFVEGKLMPIENPKINVEEESWMASGISISRKYSEINRISHLLELVESVQISKESSYADLTKLALNWAKLSALIFNNGVSRRNLEQFSEVAQNLNKSFANWLQTYFASLVSLSPSYPPLVHHIPRFLARKISTDNKKRIALLVVDGLSLDQWITVRKHLHTQNNNLSIIDNATFAWIPTITSVSRQSIFSGKPPVFFPSSISSTNSEEKLWKQFWQKSGLHEHDVVYKRGLGDGDAESVMDKLIGPSTKVIGLVIDKIDKIMHGMQLGAAGMHNQIDQWCKGRFLINLINYLIRQNFEIWLTSDHGNIESVGEGQPAEGVMAETRGERVRVYPTPELRSKYSKSFAFAIEWQTTGLPEKFYPLVATGKSAFVRHGATVVSHGGIAIEEVIVPFVKLTRSNLK